MRIQDYIADASKKAAEDAFRYARAVADDKLEWSPEGGRSVINMCRELAMTPTWGYEVISGASGEWDEAAMAAQQKLMDEWKTIDACEREFAARFEKLDTLYRTMPDADFTKTKWLPYNGGRDHTYLEMMDYPRWNCTYHLGQIAYIQTMLGDKEMH